MSENIIVFDAIDPSFAVEKYIIGQLLTLIEDIKPFVEECINKKKPIVFVPTSDLGVKVGRYGKLLLYASDKNLHTKDEVKNIVYEYDSELSRRGLRAGEESLGGTLFSIAEHANNFWYTTITKRTQSVKDCVSLLPPSIGNLVEEEIFCGASAEMKKLIKKTKNITRKEYEKFFFISSLNALFIRRKLTFEQYFEKNFPGEK